MGVREPRGGTPWASNRKTPHGCPRGAPTPRPPFQCRATTRHTTGHGTDNGPAARGATAPRQLQRDRGSQHVEHFRHGNLGQRSGGHLKRRGGADGHGGRRGCLLLYRPCERQLHGERGQGGFQHFSGEPGSHGQRKQRQWRALQRTRQHVEHFRHDRFGQRSHRVPGRRGPEDGHGRGVRQVFVHGFGRRPAPGCPGGTGTERARTPTPGLSTAGRAAPSSSPSRSRQCSSSRPHHS